MTQEEQNRLEEKLYSYGWSKGDYIHPKGCSLCLQPFTGSKRSYRCESCATKMMIDGVNLSILSYGLDVRRDTIGGLIRQRDELHATTNRYLERARAAEYALADYKAKDRAKRKAIAAYKKATDISFK